MPRYFFTVVYPDQTEIWDSIETPLRSDAAAIQLARKVIEGIREDRGPAEPDPALTVRNVAGEIVYRLPVN